MDEKDRTAASAQRQLYVVEFSPVAVWATEEERIDKLVYALLDGGDCPPVSESFTLEQLDFDEETLPYGILNNKDGSVR